VNVSNFVVPDGIFNTAALASVNISDYNM